MHRVNSLAGYGSERFVRGAFDQLSTRMKRANPLGEAWIASQPHLAQIETDFREFYPQLMDFCDEWRQNH